MLSVHLSALAREDLKSIGRYTQITWGRDQRNRYLTLIDTAFQRLGSDPELGRACDDIRSGYRKYRVGRHVIFYYQTFNILCLKVLQNLLS
jgi:toxin ParE1/3/4